MEIRKNNANLLYDVATGAAAGGAATWLMGRATTVMYDRENAAARHREEKVREGKDAFVRAAEKTAAVAGKSLTESQKKKLGGGLHWAMGIGVGALYGWLRHRRPEAAAGYGLLFGAAFFLLIDEGANTVFGFTPPPNRFPWQAHARGLVGHLVYGAAAESLLTGADRARRHVH
ncbi:MAG: DUF1440 domain-containing protein [Gemmatimonadota bacterium]